MLTISSISVSPWPQQMPTVKAQPVSATKSSNAVSDDSAGEAVPVAGIGDAGAVLATYAPSALPPASPVAESASTDLPPNAAVPDEARKVVDSALAQREAAQAAQLARGGQSSANKAVAEQARSTRFQGELPPEFKHPEQKALETKINDFVPNLWKASGAAVDVLIGDDAKAAAAARAEVFDQLAKAADNPVAAEAPVDPYAAQAAQHNGTTPPGSVISESV